jgi:hypothetical protein
VQLQRCFFLLVVGIALVGAGRTVTAQTATASQQGGASASGGMSTRLESFQPSPGSLVTVAYENLGDLNFGRVSVEVRELRDSKGEFARGVVIRVTESQTHQEQAFVDPEEIPELLRGIDAILRTTSNPTSFKSFELRYKTRGELEVSAYNTDAYVQYAIQAGHETKATALNLRSEDMAKFRAMMVAASTRLAAAARR